MYSLYFITLQRSGTRPVTKPLRSTRPEHPERSIHNFDSGPVFVLPFVWSPVTFFSSSKLAGCYFYLETEGPRGFGLTQEFLFWRGHLLDEMAKSKPREGTHGMALVRMLHLELKVYVLQKLTGFAHWRCPGLDANAMYIDIHYTYIIHTYTRAYTAADISIEGTRARTGGHDINRQDLWVDWKHW